MTLGDIQQATGLPTSTVQRLVSNMVSHGMLDRVGDHIRVGVRMSYWAATARTDVDVVAIVNPVLEEIRDKTTETACFFTRRAELPSVHRRR
jgi:DNA-binding IclR family transcriptional regulator